MFIHNIVIAVKDCKTGKLEST